jgi:transposase-like protein
MTIAEIYCLTEDEARGFIERVRWPSGPSCVHCGSKRVYRLRGNATRPGLFKCRECKCQFTVRHGTIFQDSHLPLHKWVIAFHLAVSSREGISAKELQRRLGLRSYQSAWHVVHAMRAIEVNRPVQPGHVIRPGPAIAGKEEGARRHPTWA